MANIASLFKRFQFFLYPCSVHASIYFNITHWVTCLLPLLFYLFFAPFFPAKSSLAQAHKWLNYKVFIFIALLILAVLSVLLKNYSLLYIPPILISFSILFPFARSLSAGYTPLITQFYYLTEKGNREPERVVYTTLLTKIWLILISFIIIELITLSLFAPLEIWSLFSNFINYFILAAFMVLEWLFRSLYFRQWDSPIVFIKQLILIDHRQLLTKNSAN